MWKIANDSNYIGHKCLYMTRFFQGGVVNVECACFVNLKHETNTIHN